MPFIGFLGPTWEPAVLTRILHRQNVYYHRIYEYTRVIYIFVYFSKIRKGGYSALFLSVDKAIFHNITVGNDDLDILQFFLREESQLL